MKTNDTAMKGLYMNTLEKSHIYQAVENDMQLKESHADSSDPQTRRKKRQRPVTQPTT
jgi:hypothetical protein